MKLLNPTWDELNRAFFEYVAKGHLTQADEECRRTLERDIQDIYGKDRSADENSTFIPPYSHRADIVLPWLEKCEAIVIIEYHSRFKNWQVVICGSAISGRADAKPLPRAAVIALLRAHGVEVEFTKEST